MKLLAYCPTCNGKLVAKGLVCPGCGLELANQFELSSFDYLDAEESSFLIAFLRCRGNLKQLQKEEGISYPTAKKKLEQLLHSLNLTEEVKTEELDMGKFKMTEGTEASIIIRNKLIEEGGRATVQSHRGKSYEIRLTNDGTGFSCGALPEASYKFEIFDCIVDLLKKEGGKAKKGQARGENDKVGSERCNEHTVTGIIALDYYGKAIGDSVFDPVFVLAGILDWAEIAINSRGYLELTNSYKWLIRYEA